MDSLDPCTLFGLNLRKIRENRKISQERLAELAELDRTYISGIERGRRNIGIKNIFKLANALNVPPYQLLDFDNNLPLKD